MPELNNEGDPVTSTQSGPNDRGYGPRFTDDELASFIDEVAFQDMWNGRAREKFEAVSRRLKALSGQRVAELEQLLCKAEEGKVDVKVTSDVLGTNSVMVSELPEHPQAGVFTDVERLDLRINDKT